MLSQVRRVLRRSSRWYLRHGDKTVDIESAITSYKASYQDLTQNLENYMVESEYADMQQQAEGLIAQGVPKDVAYQVTSLSNLFCCLDLAQVAETEKRSISLVANLYFKLGHRLELHWFLEQINKQTVSNHWQALARASYREELDWQQRSITSVLLKNHPEDEDADHMLEAWMSSNELLLQRWRHMMAEFKTSTTHEFAKFSVALREIMLLSINASN
jgi:glutamate dehydrogenase